MKDNELRIGWSDLLVLIVCAPFIAILFLLTSSRR